MVAIKEGLSLATSHLYMECGNCDMEYFINQPGCQSKVLSCYVPSQRLSCTYSWTAEKSFVPLATVKISVSSYVVFIPNPKHWKDTGKNINFIPGYYLIFLEQKTW